MEDQNALNEERTFSREQDELALTYRSKYKKEVGLFPLEAFPISVQNFIMGLVSNNKFCIEYVSAAVLSAVGAVCGKNVQLLLNDGWSMTPALYIVLVGRSGLGKSPPAKIVLSPVHDIDSELWRDYQTRLEEFENSGKSDKATPPHETGIYQNDCTPEALKYALADNPNGILLFYDEFSGFLKGLYRYGHNSMVADLLTYFTGGDVKVSRVMGRSSYIQDPCLGILGTIQDDTVGLLFQEELLNCGLTHRFIFVYPSDQRLSHVPISSTPRKESVGISAWKEMVRHLYANAYCLSSPLFVKLNREGAGYFDNWSSLKIKEAECDQVDKRLRDRIPKMNYFVGKIALILHLLDWADKKGPLKDIISAHTILDAISLCEYFESGYRRLVMESAKLSLSASEKDFLDQLPDKFTRGEAVKIGEKIPICRRSVQNYLDRFINNFLIKRVSTGNYEKL